MWAEEGTTKAKDQKAGFLRTEETAASCLRMQSLWVWDRSSAFHSPHPHHRLLKSNSESPVWRRNGASASH